MESSRNNEQKNEGKLKRNDKKGEISVTARNMKAKLRKKRSTKEKNDD